MSSFPLCFYVFYLFFCCTQHAVGGRDRWEVGEGWGLVLDGQSVNRCSSSKLNNLPASFGSTARSYRVTGWLTRLSPVLDALNWKFV